MPIQPIKIKEYRYLDILINFQDEGNCYKTYITVKNINDEKKLINCNIIENNTANKKKRI